MTLDQWQLIQSAGVGGLLAFALIGGFRGWYVWGRQFLDMKADVSLVSTVADSRERAQVAAALIELVRIERETLALETSVQANIDLTRQVGVKADAAYDAANHADEKLTALTRRIAAEENKP